MKVGILTYHRTLNYGACLQAVATRVILESMGYDVFYVDYWPKYHKSAYALFSIDKLMRLSFIDAIKYIIIQLTTYKYKKERIKKFESFLAEYIYPYSKPINEKFDVVIYGSDQIWRKQKSLKAYNFVYFADNNFNTKRHIAYAASMGSLPVDDAEIKLISEKLKKFDKISVRESDLLILCHGMGYKNAKLVLDPTLLLDKAKWQKIIKERGIKLGFKYVIVYGIGNVPIKLEDIRNYAKERSCEVVYLHSVATGMNSLYHYYTANPFDFVSLILNSECVFTSSFHGLAFSINLNKEFYASFDKTPSRAITLLTNIHLIDRLIEPYKSLPKLETINYSIVNELLNSERNDSIKFLNLNEIQ